MTPQYLFTQRVSRQNIGITACYQNCSFFVLVTKMLDTIFTMDEISDAYDLNLKGKYHLDLGYRMLCIGFVIVASVFCLFVHAAYNII